MIRIDCADENLMLFDCSPDRAYVIPALLFGTMFALAVVFARAWVFAPVALGLLGGAAYLLFYRGGVLLNRASGQATRFGEFFRLRRERSYSLKVVYFVNVVEFRSGKETFYTLRFDTPTGWWKLGATTYRDDATKYAEELAVFLNVPHSGVA